MPQPDSTTYKISDKQADYARRISAQMSDSITRKKGLVEIIGLSAAVNYFSQNGFSVNIQKSLHKIPEIYEKFKISDFYVNNYRIDAVTLFRDNKIKIPYEHVKYECVPDYYVVIEVSDRIKDARIIGYLKPHVVNIAHEDNGYLVVGEHELRNIDELKKDLKTPAYPRQIEGRHLDCIGMFLEFIDGELSEDDKRFLIKHILACSACSKKLADVIEFNKTALNIPNLDVLLKDNPQTVKREELIDIKSKEIKQEPKQEIGLPVATRKIYGLNENDTSEGGKKFKNIIDGIFEHGVKMETPGNITYISSRPNKKLIVIFACIGILIFSITCFAIKATTDSNMSSISDADQYSSYADTEAQAEFESTHALPQELYNDLGANVDYSLATQVTGEPIIATINKISWEVPENLADKTNYKKFLQLVGKNIKLNLQNDLLLSNDFAKNNVIKVNIKIASSGDIIGMKIVQGSGSQQIDEIIKKSVTETLSYMKPPSLGFISRSVDVTLVISL